MASNRELSPLAFWGILALVAVVVIGAVYVFANPNTGDRAPSGGPPPVPKGSSSASPPPPPASGFPTHSN